MMALGLISGLRGTADGASYAFVNIADGAGHGGTFVNANGGIFAGFGYPSVNNAGTVAFRAGVPPTGHGFFIGTGGAATTIADRIGPVGFASRINTGGTVTFWAWLPSGPRVFTGDGGPLTTIARIQPFSSFTSITTGNPSINDSGTVVFPADLVGGGDGIFVGNGGPISTIADPSGQFARFREMPGGFAEPVINNGGTVAFWAQLDTGVTGIFTGDGGPTYTTIADDTGLFNEFYAVSVDINNDGTVAFRASLDGGGEGIYTGNGGAVTTVVNSSGAFDQLYSPTINNGGLVAFQAHLDAGGHGIFTGPNAVSDKVIQTGDPLFGSTVEELGFWRGMNDYGDIAFRYKLSNGIIGIALAEVPEPASVALLGLAGVVMVRRSGMTKLQKPMAK